MPNLNMAQFMGDMRAPFRGECQRGRKDPSPEICETLSGNVLTCEGCGGCPSPYNKSGPLLERRRVSASASYGVASGASAAPAGPEECAQDTGTSTPLPVYTTEERIEDLPERDRKILELVAEDRSNGEIARKLGIGVEVVAARVSSICVRLGLRDADRKDRRRKARDAWRQWCASSAPKSARDERPQEVACGAEEAPRRVALLAEKMRPYLGMIQVMGGDSLRYLTHALEASQDELNAALQFLQNQEAGGAPAQGVGE